jgi:hypothetical protein
MAEHEGVDLQHEADHQRATGDEWPPKSEGPSQRLEAFKQGEIDRWGREVGMDTPMEDFYVERQ